MVLYVCVSLFACMQQCFHKNFTFDKEENLPILQFDFVSMWIHW